VYFEKKILNFTEKQQSVPLLIRLSLNIYNKTSILISGISLPKTTFLIKKIKGNS